MQIKVVVHEAEEGGFWAEVPAIPGCATQGETMDELLRNLHEAIEGCRSVEVVQPTAIRACHIRSNCMDAARGAGKENICRRIT